MYHATSLLPGAECKVLNDVIPQKLGAGDRGYVRFRTRRRGSAGRGGAGELLVHQAGEEQQRVAWPVVHHDALGLPGGVAGDRDDDAEGLAFDLRGVVLEEAVVAVVAGEAEVLELMFCSASERRRS